MATNIHCAASGNTSGSSNINILPNWRRNWPFIPVISQKLVVLRFMLRFLFQFDLWSHVVLRMDSGWGRTITEKRTPMLCGLQWTQSHSPQSSITLDSYATTRFRLRNLFPFQLAAKQRGNIILSLLRLLKVTERQTVFGGRCIRINPLEWRRHFNICAIFWVWISAMWTISRSAGCLFSINVCTRQS